MARRKKDRKWWLLLLLLFALKPKKKEEKPKRVLPTPKAPKEKTREKPRFGGGGATGTW